MSMAAKNRAKRIGRKQRSAVARYPGGQIVHADREPAETRESIMATALAQPHRRGLSRPADPLAGFAAGRLYRCGVLTKPQFQAMERYHGLAIKYSNRAPGLSIKYPTFHMERLSRGGGQEWEDVLAVQSVEDEMERANRTIFDACPGDSDAAQRALLWALFMNVDHLPPDELGALRCGLNALARLWGMGE